MRPYVFLSYCWLLLSGCAGEGPKAAPAAGAPAPGGSAIDFATQVQPVFDQHCSCHLVVSPPQGLLLREGASYDSIFETASLERPDLLLVNPGEPDLSYLVIKIDDRVPDVSSLRAGDKMPPNLPPVPLADIDIIRQWIVEGALRTTTDDGGDPEIEDSQPPQFEGIDRAVAVSSAEVDLFWAAAVDDVSPSEAVIYSVFVAVAAGSFDSSQRDYLAAAGTTFLRVGGLAAATDYYFVVRAEDEAGNQDDNEVEATARTLDPPGTVPPTINGPPSADPGGPYEVALGDVVTLTGAQSTDPDGDPLTFAWDFGDDTTGAGETIEHTYESAGEFTVTLIVSDGDLESEPATTSVTVAEAPGFPQDPVVASVCSQCHGLRVRLGDGTIVDLSPPGEGLASFPAGVYRTGRLRNAAGWASTVARMRRNTDGRAETTMSDEEQDQITRFLSENYSDEN